MAEQGALDLLEDNDANDLRELRRALDDVRTGELVGLMGRVSQRRRALLFRLLPKDRALDVFEALDTGLASELLGGLRADTHAEHGRTIAQPQEDRAGIGAEFDRFVDRQQRSRASFVLLHHKRVAKHHVGARVAMAFQRKQFRVVGAQMRGTVENVGNEGGLAQRKWSCCFCRCHELNQARFWRVAHR